MYMYMVYTYMYVHTIRLSYKRLESRNENMSESESEVLLHVHIHIPLSSLPLCVHMYNIYQLALCGIPQVFTHQLNAINTRVLMTSSNKQVVLGLYNSFKQAQVQ